MSQRRETARLGQFTAAAAQVQHLRVKRTAANASIVEVAGDEDFLGTTLQIAYKAGDPQGVYQKGAPGTNIYISADPIVKGALVYTAAAGRVSDIAGDTFIGIAEHATAAAGELIEVGPGFEPPA